MPTVAIIPVKSFRLGKQRLGAHLTESRRAALGRALTDRVAAAAATAGLLPLIVTADPEVAEWALLNGLPSIDEPGEGLDGAATAGVEWAAASASNWLVVHSDLPFLTTNDIGQVAVALSSGRQPISPSSDGGTSVIGGAGPMRFRFGVASFHRHLALLESPQVISRPGLALDIDSIEDLEAAAGDPRGHWLRDLVTA